MASFVEIKSELNFSSFFIDLFFVTKYVLKICFKKSLKKLE